MHALHYKSCPAVDHSLDCLVAGHAVPRGFGLDALIPRAVPEISSQVPLEALPMLFGAMLGYFLVPLLAIILISYADSAIGPGIRWRPLRRLHFLSSLVYSITNILHLLSDILLPDARLDQIALMEVMALLGLLINIEGWHWWRQYH